MTAAESPNKIRQIAIVLTSVDATTSRRILSSLPSEMARSIRRLIGNLGTVSPQEYDAACKALQPIFGITPKQKSVAHQNNPAAQILSSHQDSFDRSDISFASSMQSASDESLHKSIYDIGHEPSATQTALPLIDATPAEWAQILASERPIIIAAVIAQAPQKFASEILQRLPGTTAIETLSAMPKIGTTSTEVLEEISGQLKDRLKQYRQQKLSQQWGLLKAKSIFESLPAEMQSQWVTQVQTEDPTLALELASLVKVVAPELKPVEKEYVRELKSVELGHTTHAYDVEDFDSLQHLSLSNLAEVIRASEPETILIALAGASKRWLARFEKLMHPGQLARLHERLKSQPIYSLNAIDEAQSQIVAIAAKLGHFQIDPSELLAA